jgi:uncharacterized membrane protein YgaE (UPF0421/DUF939 family)
MNNLTVEIRDAYTKAIEYINTNRTIISKASVDDLYKKTVENIKNIHERYRNNEGVFSLSTNNEYNNAKLRQEIKTESNRFLRYVSQIIDIRRTTALEEELYIYEKNKEFEKQQRQLLDAMSQSGKAVAIVDPGLPTIPGLIAPPAPTVLPEGRVSQAIKTIYAD